MKRALKLVRLVGKALPIGSFLLASALVLLWERTVFLASVVFSLCVVLGIEGTVGECRGLGAAAMYLCQEVFKMCWVRNDCRVCCASRPFLNKYFVHGVCVCICAQMAVPTECKPELYEIRQLF